MEQLEQKTIVEVALYILQKTGGLSMYHLLKTIYFAHREFVAKHGFPMVEDDFRALQYGPVPMWLYNEIKKGEKSTAMGSAICHLGDDAKDTLIADRSPNLDYLSTAMIAELDSAIAKYSSLSFQQLLDLSHDEHWKRAFDGNGDMHLIDIARSGGASEGMVAYISEGLDIQLALS